jgi:hypothetical protein
MAVIKLTGFMGEAPRVTPRLLPDRSAQSAVAVRLEDGELSPFRKPFLVEDLSGLLATSIETIYLHQGDWLYWDTVVNAAPGPVAQDRLYFTGDGVPKMTVAGVTYDLKVTAPTVELTATPVGAVGSLYDTRIYVYTFVTDFGEESEPSPLSIGVDVSPGQTVTLSGFSAAPGGRNITKQRIYRSQTGGSQTTRLYFVGERAASVLDYSDTVNVTDFAEPLPSADFNPPPDELTGLTTMPNGIMVGFVGRDLYFCEPFIPHAWPQKYVLTADYEIVALAAQGTSLIVGTTGHPYVVNGTAPETMVMDKMELNLPCLSARGMVDLGYASAYPSHDGLVVVQGGVPRIITAELFTRDQWRMMNPDTMVAAQFYGRYFCSYEYTDADGITIAGTVLIDLSGASPFVIRSQYKADCMFYELATGSLFMGIGESIYEWDSPQSVNDVFTWKSKVFVMPAPTSFGAILFEADQPNDDGASAEALAAANAAIQAANQAIIAAGTLFGSLGSHMINEYPANGDSLVGVQQSAVSVNVYADREFVATVTTPGVMQRLPGGKMAREWEIEVTGTVNVQEVTMAGTGRELRGA